MFSLWLDVSLFRLSVSQPGTIPFANADENQAASQQLVPLQVWVWDHQMGLSIHIESTIHTLLSIMQAAVIIQRHTRGLQTRQYMFRLRRAAVCLQARWRCRQATLNFSVMRHSAIRVQARVRGRMVRKQLAKMQAAAVMIQVCKLTSSFAKAAVQPGVLPQHNMLWAPLVYVL